MPKQSCTSKGECCNRDGYLLPLKCYRVGHDVSAKTYLIKKKKQAIDIHNKSQLERAYF
jgi:hypothetical protein